MEVKTERKSFPEAVRTLLGTMEKGSTFSLSDLSRQAGLNRRTVEKALGLLTVAQNYLQENKLEVTNVAHTKVVRFSKRSGLLGLPEELQRLIIKTAYYPSPSREEEILVYAYRREAVSPEKAVEMEESALVKKLLEQGQFGKTSKGNVFLTDEGKIVAEGALKLYPELKDL
jgi:hypothetical protein